MGSIALYEYEPSVAAAVIFAILYTLTCGVTIFQYFKLRCWFWIFMVIASIMESVGYIARILSAKNTGSTFLYALSFLPIFLAPAVIAASCYMAMGRVILHVTPKEHLTWKTLWTTPRWMTPFFVSCDVVSFLIQVVGGLQSTLSDTVSGQESAFRIMKIGLVIQLICFGLFIIISFRFHMVSPRFQVSWPDHRWKKLLLVLNIASCLIFIRSVYRMIEFCTGFDGYLYTHEWNFYVFESVVVLPALALFNIWHPSYFLSNTGWKQKQTKDGEAQGPISDGYLLAGDRDTRRYRGTV